MAVEQWAIGRNANFVLMLLLADNFEDDNEERPKKKARAVWTREWLKRREKRGAFQVVDKLMLRRKLTARVLHGSTCNKFVIFCCRFLMVVQKLATCCRNKKSLKVVTARHVTRDNFPRNICCAESCCCELSRVTSP